jgi:hypothetical protein
MKRLILTLTAIAALMAAAPAVAHPVSVARATQAVRADDWDFGATPPTVSGCVSNRFGTMCQATIAVYYTDPVAGPAMIVNTQNVWVSQDRRHRVHVHVFPNPGPFDVWTVAPGATPGDTANVR